MTKEILLAEAKTYIQEKSINAAELGRRCGVHESQMQYYLRGKRQLNDKDAQKIAKFLNIPFESIPKDSKQKQKQRRVPGDAVGIEKDARTSVNTLKRLRRYDTDTKSATVLIQIGMDTLLKVGVSNFNFEPYE